MGAATANFDVVGMSAEAQDPKALAAIFSKASRSISGYSASHWPQTCQGALPLA